MICPECHGSGSRYDATGELQTCQSCDGMGSLADARAQAIAADLAIAILSELNRRAKFTLRRMRAAG